MPHISKDPIVIASSLVAQLQTIVSRNVPPIEPLVLSVTKIHAGTAYNVIPSDCVVSGTMRYFSKEMANMVRQRMSDLTAGLAKSYGVEIDIVNQEILMLKYSVMLVQGRESKRRSMTKLHLKLVAV